MRRSGKLKRLICRRWRHHCRRTNALRSQSNRKIPKTIPLLYGSKFSVGGEMNELLQFTAPTDLIPLKNVFRYRVEKTGWSVPDIGESDGMEIPCRALN